MPRRDIKYILKSYRLNFIRPLPVYETITIYNLNTEINKKAIKIYYQSGFLCTNYYTLH